jgi:hypothetical protein
VVVPPSAVVPLVTQVVVAAMMPPSPAAVPPVPMPVPPLPQLAVVAATVTLAMPFDLAPVPGVPVALDLALVTSPVAAVFQVGAASLVLQVVVPPVMPTARPLPLVLQVVVLAMVTASLRHDVTPR